MRGTHMPRTSSVITIVKLYELKGEENVSSCKNLERSVKVISDNNRWMIKNQSVAKKCL
jgi:hypothetical protein